MMLSLKSGLWSLSRCVSKSPTSGRLIAGLAVLAAWATPLTNADACDPDPCDGTPRFSSFYAVHERVATDGVLVFEGRRGSDAEIDNAEAAESVTVRVTTPEGAELDGALEATEGLYVWRPQDALPADVALAVEIEIDNEALSDDDFCTVEPLPTTITVGPGPLPDLSLPSFETETTYQFSADRDYPSLVCCDGAYPSDQEDSCGGISPDWGSEGFCVYREGVGHAQVSITGADAQPPEVAAALRYELVADGEVVASQPGPMLDLLGARFDSAVTFEIHAISLVDGTDLVSESYTVDVGDDTLGAHTRDIQADLDANCSAPAYVCEVGPTPEGLSGWDPEMCEPFDPDAGGSETEGESETEGSETDGAETDGGPGSAESGDGSETGTDSDTEGSASGGADGASEGCSCRADADEGRAGWMMVLFGLALGWRRRRSHRG